MLLLVASLSCLASPEFEGAKVKWSFETRGPVRADAVIDNDQVYVASTDGGLYALRKEDGKKIWKMKARGALVGEPSVHGNMVAVVSRDNKVYAVNRKSGCSQAA